MRLALASTLGALALALPALAAPDAGQAPEKTAEKPAEKAPEKPAVEDLSSPAKVKDVCLAVRPTGRVYFEGDPAAQADAKGAYDKARGQAMDRLYRARIQGGGFKLGDYRQKDSALELDLSRTLRSLHGALLVAMPSDSDVLFSVSPETAKAASEAVKSGTATLDAYFELDDDTGMVCAGSAAAGVFTVQAKPVAFELRDGVGQLLGRAETQAADKHRAILGGYSGTPTVQVGTVIAQGDADAKGLARRLEAVVEPVKRCYVRRLEEKAGAGGTVILGVEVGGDGKVGSVEFTADALGDEVLRKCVDETVRTVKFAGVAGLPTLFRVPVELKLQSK